MLGIIYKGLQVFAHGEHCKSGTDSSLDANLFRLTARVVGIVGTVLILTQDRMFIDPPL